MRYLPLRTGRGAPNRRASARVRPIRGSLREPFGYALRWREARC